MGRFAKQWESLYRRFRDDIFTFCRLLNFTPTWQQAKVLEMIQDSALGRGKKRLAVKSGQGPGKSTCSGVGALWRTLRFVDTMGIVTAPTQRQCREVWLAELSRTLENADPLIKRFVKVTKSRVRVGNRDKWGIETVTATRPENAQGYHEKHMFWIVEEASGVKRPFIEQIMGTLTNEDSMLLQIGNPNTRDCAFFDCFNTQRSRWDTFTMNAEESPIVSKENITLLEEQFGRDSDIFRVRVLGEFPHSDPNCVMSSEELEKCIFTEAVVAAQVPRGAGGRAGPAKQFGLDFARYGGDENVLYRRSGQAVVDWKFFAHTDPNDLVDLAFRMQLEAKWPDNEVWYVPDAGGMGQGVMRRFYQAGKQVHEFHNGGVPQDTRMYANRITEAWFTFAHKVRTSPVKIPKDNVLIEQLANRQYFVDKKGKLILETKDEYMDRGYSSPDRADALVLCFYDSVSTSGRSARVGTETDVRSRVGGRVRRPR